MLSVCTSDEMEEEELQKENESTRKASGKTARMAAQAIMPEI